MIAKRRLDADKSVITELAEEIVSLGRGDYSRSGHAMTLEHWCYNQFADLTDGKPKIVKDAIWAEVKEIVYQFPPVHQEA